MSEPAIKVDGLSKRYRIGVEEEQHDTLFGAMASWVQSPMENYRRVKRLSSFGEDEADDIIWALKDVSFEVERGEVVGVIGRNGAGKSTLLKILSHITEPTSGYAKIRGRVSSLLEVGTGFHDELTGRENVYLNGTILGMSKAEVDRKFDEIVAFSGIEKFIDTPVKRYSSGMKVRLAFAVAAHLEPEILLIDEVLAVGDAAFQKKCLGKMDDITQEGRTVLFVSHDMGAIRSLCSRTVLLEDGTIRIDGKTAIAIREYLDSSGASEDTAVWRGAFRGRDGQADITLKEIQLQRQDGEPSTTFSRSDDICIHIRYSVHAPLEGARIKLRLIDSQGSIVVTTTDITADSSQHRECGEYVSVCHFPGQLLNDDRYTVLLFATIPFVKTILPKREYLTFEVERTEYQGSTAPEELNGVLNPYIPAWSLRPANESIAQSA